MYIVAVKTIKLGDVVVLKTLKQEDAEQCYLHIVSFLEACSDMRIVPKEERHSTGVTGVKVYNDNQKGTYVFMEYLAR